MGLAERKNLSAIVLSHSYSHVEGDSDDEESSRRKKSKSPHRTRKRTIVARGSGGEGATPQMSHIQSAEAWGTLFHEVGWAGVGPGWGKRAGSGRGGVGRGGTEWGGTALGGAGRGGMGGAPSQTSTPHPCFSPCFNSHIYIHSHTQQDMNEPSSSESEEEEESSGVADSGEQSSEMHRKTMFQRASSTIGGALRLGWDGRRRVLHPCLGALGDTRRPLSWLSSQCQAALE